MFQLAQCFKEVKAKGVTVIQEMSADIAKKAQEVGSNESKQEFIDACESLKDIPQVHLFDPIRVPHSLIVSSLDRIKGNRLRDCQVCRVS